MIRTYSILDQPSLVHGFSTRVGGFSRDPYDSQNMGLNSGDDKLTVKKNRTQFFAALEVDPSLVAYPSQVHATRVALVDSSGIYNATDALICNTTGLFVTIQTADCFPVFLFDPIHAGVGIVHSGWHGTAGNITQRTIEAMGNYFGSKSADILAVIGPGVQPAQYQVGLSTASYFSSDYLKADGPDHFFLDLMACIVDQLISAGLANKHIETDNTCTYLAADTFYSYRRDGKKSGRMMGLIGIR